MMSSIVMAKKDEWLKDEGNGRMIAKERFQFGRVVSTSRRTEIVQIPLEIVVALLLHGSATGSTHS